jgi:hypothetical protein
MCIYMRCMCVCLHTHVYCIFQVLDGLEEAVKRTKTKYIREWHMNTCMYVCIRVCI